MFEFAKKVATAGAIAGGIVVATVAAPITVGVVTVGIIGAVVLDSRDDNDNNKKTDIPVAKPVKSDQKPLWSPKLQQVLSFAGDEFTFVEEYEGKTKRMALYDHADKRKSKFFTSFIVRNDKIYGVDDGNNELVAEKGSKWTKLIDDPVPKLLQLCRKDVQSVRFALDTHLYDDGVKYAHQLKKGIVRIHIDGESPQHLRSIYCYDRFIYGVDGNTTKTLHISGMYSMPSALLQFINAYLIIGEIIYVFIGAVKYFQALSDDMVIPSCSKYIILAHVAVAASHALNCCREKRIVREEAISLLRRHIELQGLEDKTFDALLHDVSCHDPYPEPVFHEHEYFGYTVLTLHSRFSNRHAIGVLIFGHVFGRRAVYLMICIIAMIIGIVQLQL